MRYSDRADTIRAAARGQWRQIHAALGIPPGALTDRHQPCPCCGGRDRFRYDDKDGSGSFICSHFANGGGDGFHLVEHYLDCDFPAALRAVAGVLCMGEGEYTAPPLKRPECPSVPCKDQSGRIARLWTESAPIATHDPVSGYLRGRGLTAFAGAALRYHPALPYWDTSGAVPVHVGDYPAMLASITNERGQQGIHRTWIRDGRKLAKKMLANTPGSTKGCAIRLFPATDRLAVTEGIENALAAHELSGLPAWACMSAGGLAALDLPDVQNLYIYCDADPVGMDAGRRLADRATRAGITVRLCHAETGDALDALNRSRHEHH